jgi:hypothetical protein
LSRLPITARRKELCEWRQSQTAEELNLSANKIDVLAPKTASKEITFRRASKAIRSIRRSSRHKDLAKTYDAVWEVRGHCKDFETLTEAHLDRVPGTS